MQRFIAIMETEKLKRSRNVRIALLFTSLYSFSMGIWGMVILGPYLYDISGGSNTKVGYAEGIQGAALAISAIPSGIFSDRYKRSNILQASTIFGVVAIILTMFSLFCHDASLSYVHMTVALAFWGLFRGTFDPPLKSIFADSVPHGERSKYFTYLYNCTIVTSASGPLLNMIVFWSLGNSHVWELNQMKTIFMIGVSIAIATPPLLFMFVDPDEFESSSMQSPLIPGENTHQALRATATTGKWIPVLVTSSDIISGLASGMTVKFFPLFFENESQFSPVLVNSIFVVTPLLTCVFAIYAQSTSQWLGRIQVSTIVKTIGIAILFFMSFCHSIWKSPAIIVPIFIVRTALMNCTRGLMKSILMDAVPSDERAKWNSLESISSFGWSGSAVLGGALTDKYGYGMTFVVTALLQSLGLVLSLFLLPIVPIESPHT